MSESGLKISTFVQQFSLEILNRGSDYDEAQLTITDVNRPGLQFQGFFDYFDPPPPAGGRQGGDSCISRA
jgi:HPr kinase/phosphorylase